MIATDLQDLDLIDTPVTGEGLQHLWKLKRLRRIWLSSVKITPSDVEQLRDHLPRLTRGYRGGLSRFATGIWLMMAKRVLVTGCNGYIGSVLVPKLLAQGVQVSGLDTDLYRDADFAEFPKVCRNALDVRDVTLADLEHCDAVIHLAALSNDPLGNLDAELTFDINYRPGANLARMAKQAGVQRFLFSSSCSTYGASGDALLNEDAAFNPVTPYGRSKVLAESEIAGLADDRFSPTFPECDRLRSQPQIATGSGRLRFCRGSLSRTNAF